MVEVLCAILILGVALVGMSEAVTLSLHCTRESEEQTTAAMLASGLIEKLRAEGGLADGMTEGGSPAYHWRQTLSRTDINGLHEVVVLVENQQTSKRIYELRTLLFERPADSDANKPGAGRRPGKAERRGA
jgi:Tfp pilus assembly protein PilV